MVAEERPTHRKLHSNNNTIQHCRPKPSPSSTAVPVRHDPAQGDVRHQGEQGEGQVQPNKEQVPRPLPAQGDAHHVRHAQAKKGIPARVPGKGGGQVQADVEQVQHRLPAQGDVRHRTEFFKKRSVTFLNIVGATTRTTGGAH